MKRRNQNLNRKSFFSHEEIRTALLFWAFWSAYTCLSALLIAALLTDWPEFLHPQNYFR